MSVLPPGAPAPEFTLKTAEGEDFTREDLKGHGSVLVFYPFAFSPVCTDQLQLYEPLLEDLAGRDVRLYGVSCDSAWAQSAFKEKLGVSSEQLSDFEPKGAASEAFGVRHPGGFSQRALVITDAEGVVRWSYEAENPGVLPGPDLLAQGVVAAFGEDRGA
jgi:peroxiredoxin (alkyl hydroperoxide reductase subunit C)